METSGNRPRGGVLVLGMGVAAVSWAAIFVRLGDEAPPLALAAYRLLIAAIAMGAVAVAAARRTGEGLPGRGSWGWLVLSGALLAGHFWSWFASLDHTSVGSSVVIVAMQPLLAGGLGLAFLGERPRRSEGVGIALALAGMLVIGGRDLASSPGELGGDGLALLGAGCVAAHHTVGRRLRSGMSAATYSATVYAVAAVTLWLLVAILRPAIGGFGGDTWTFIALLAFIPQLIGHTAFNWALAHFRVVTVSMVIMIEPIAATLLAIPILGEWPTVAVAIGGPLIVAGVLVGLRGLSGDAAPGPPSTDRALP